MQPSDIMGHIKDTHEKQSYIIITCGKNNSV